MKTYRGIQVQLCPFLSFVGDVYEIYYSCHSFTLEQVLCIHWVVCSLSPRAAVGAVEEEKIICAYPRYALELVFWNIKLKWKHIGLCEGSELGTQLDFWFMQQLSLIRFCGDYFQSLQVPTALSVSTFPELLLFSFFPCSFSMCAASFLSYSSHAVGRMLVHFPSISCSEPSLGSFVNP